jgi:predicted transcriptional regulator of viral defense system
MRPEVDKDRQLAALASAQHGVVASRQLLAIGLSAQSVKRRVRGGRLHPIHRGVYAVGHTVLTVEGRWMAATLATGGVLSHATAASAWELRLSASGLIHVTVGTAGRVRRKDIRLHRSNTLRSHDITTHRAIPITTPLRTIVDLAKTLNGRPLEHVLDRADHLRLIDFGELARRPIPPSLRAVLSLYTASTPTRSELEERFLQLCDDHGIPRPETNSIIEGHEVDFVWRTQRLIVEVDGYAYHRSPSAFEQDRERDVTLAVAGWRVLRFTWAQVTRRPAWVARALDM